MKRVVLVNPPALYLIDPHCQAPLGLMYLSASLKAVGIPCEIMNLVGVPHDEIRFPPDVAWVGITSTSLDYPSALTVKEKARQQLSGVNVVIGGPHATAMREDVQKQGWDYVVCGECERDIAGFHRNVFSRPALPKPLGRVLQGHRVRNLDLLPYPDREGIDVIGGDIFIDRAHYAEGRASSTSISFSRGCVYSCAFCSLKAVAGRGVRYRSPEGVRAEVTHCFEKHGIREYRLVDDCLNFDTEKMLSIARAISDLNVYWRASFTVNRDNRGEVYRELFASGCRELSFGVESGDPNVLKVLNKHQSLEQCREALSAATAAGIKTRILMIMGCPGETEATLSRNITFCESVPHTSVALKKFVPLPGSPIYEHPEQFGCEIVNRNWEDYNFYLYGRDETTGQVRRVTPVSLIRCSTIDPKRQMAHLQAMERYLEKRRKSMWAPEEG